MTNPTRRLLEALAGHIPEAESPCSWQPAADVCRLRDGWLIKFDLAGVRAEDIHLQRNGRRLTVLGVRRDWLLEAGSRYYSLEISYNRFHRTVELPTPIEEFQIATDYRDGMLYVRLQNESSP